MRNSNARVTSLDSERVTNSQPLGWSLQGHQAPITYLLTDLLTYLLTDLRNCLLTYLFPQKRTFNEKEIAILSRKLQTISVSGTVKIIKTFTRFKKEILILL